MGWGGLDYDFANAVCSDLSGNVFCAGTFSNQSDFDPGTSVYNLTSNGNTDIYVLKLDSNGGFVWAKSFGANLDEVVSSVRADKAGNIIIAGYYKGNVDFDPGSGTTIVNSIGAYDMFLLKLDPNGNFLWIKTIAGSGNDYLSSMSLDSNDNIYLSGSFYGTVDFDPGPGAYFLTNSAGSYDAFAAKLDVAGNFIWAKSTKGIGAERAFSINVDKQKNVVLVGQFDNISDLNPGVGSFTVQSKGVEDVFVCKLDSNGNFKWGGAFGGTSTDCASAVSTDNNGNVIVGGWFNHNVDFDISPTSTYTITSFSNQDYYFVKFDSNGVFNWVNSITNGTIGNWYNLALTTNNSNEILVTGGYRTNVDFDPGVGTYIMTGGFGHTDVFVCKYSSTGGFLSAKKISGGAEDASKSIYFDSNNNLYVSGFFSVSANFNAPLVYSLYSAGNADAFVVKYKLTFSTNNIESKECDMKISPNPTTGDFGVEFCETQDELDIVITDVLGNVIKKGRPSSIQKFTERIEAPSGIYFISILTSKSQSVFKIIKTE